MKSKQFFIKQLIKHSSILVFIFFDPCVQAYNQVVDLHINYKTINFTGCPSQAISVNNQIPAPTLHFKEGDCITINVHNHLDTGTSIHWHGILVPWQMDGVEHVNQKAIPPGCVFHYRFKLYQRGTYWYHAHAGAQEQDGLYGAFLIDPPGHPHYTYTKDYVVVLSDWSDMKGHNIFLKLKKDGDYFSPLFPLQPSLMKFIHDYGKACPEERKKLLDDYKMMQQMRMSIYDISDVAYDSYLLNGRTKASPWTAPVKVGDIVRLRFIGAAGSTIYRVKIPCAQMQMVHVQGNDVKPYTVRDFTIAPGETYDVLVKIQKTMPYIIYAESIDTLGKAYGALVVDPCQPIPFAQVQPFPEPLPVTREMMENMMMMSMEHGSMSHDSVNHGSMAMKNHAGMKMANMKSPREHGMASMKKNTSEMQHDMGQMQMPTEPTIIGDWLCPPPNSSKEMTMGTKYQDLTALVKTNDPRKPVYGVIKMELFGYMGRFIWFINGLPEYRAHPICILPGKRYRIVFINNSMMRHPMHIHGHWFILRNGHDTHDPLLHTIEVPPGAMAVADVDADASGQWFFHCHHLFHMMSGMARVFQYETIVEVAHGTTPPENYAFPTNYINRPIVREDITMPLDCSLIPHPMGHHQGFYSANWLDVSEDPFNNVQELTFKGLYGGDYNKLELFINDSELSDGQVEYFDIDIFYWHLISQFWALKGGVNYFYRPGGPYWQPGIGIEGLMPYFIETNFRTYYHDGSVKFDLELSRDTQITNNFFIRPEIRSIWATKTVTEDMIGSGLNQMRYFLRPYYRLRPGLNIYTELEYDQDYGAFKRIQGDEGQATSETTLSFGLSVLF